MGRYPEMTAVVKKSLAKELKECEGWTRLVLPYLEHVISARRKLLETCEISKIREIRGEIKAYKLLRDAPNAAIMQAMVESELLAPDDGPNE